MRVRVALCRDDEECIQHALKLAKVTWVVEYHSILFLVSILFPRSYLTGGTIPTPLLFLVETIFITPLVVI